jgi:hypothetical protein
MALAPVEGIAREFRSLAMACAGVVKAAHQEVVEHARDPALAVGRIAHGRGAERRSTRSVA